MNTLYKHVVGTPWSGTKKGMKRVSSDAKKGKTARNMIFFTSCYKGLSFLKKFPNNSKSTIIISRKTDVSRGTYMCLNITYHKVHVIYLYVCQRRVI